MQVWARGGSSIRLKTETEQRHEIAVMTNRRRRKAGGRPAALGLVTRALVDRKAVDAVVLDLRGLSSATDYFIIASGTSDAHVRGMAEHLMTALDERPHHVEGLAQGR